MKPVRRAGDRLLLRRCNSAADYLREVLPANQLPARGDRRFDFPASLHHVDIERSLAENRILSKRKGIRCLVVAGSVPMSILTIGKGKKESYVLEGQTHAVDFLRFRKIVEYLRKSVRGRLNEVNLFSFRPLPLEMMRVGRIYLWRILVAGSKGGPTIGSRAEFLAVFREIANDYLTAARGQAFRPGADPSASEIDDWF